MKLISKSEVPPLRRTRSSAKPKAPKRTWTVKKWTSVIGTDGEHDVWATLDSAGHPVAFGSESKMKEYAAKLRNSGGLVYDLSKDA
jgi:hypothetical protein